MARIIMALIMLLLWGCAHGSIKPETRAATPNSKLATDVLTASGDLCNLYTLRCYGRTWRETGWNRLSDAVAPDYVVLAADGTACPVFGLLVHPPQPDKFWQCVGQWRHEQAQED